MDMVTCTLIALIAIFIFTHNKNNTVMASVSSNQPPVTTTESLNTNEIAFLLEVIKQSKFSGQDIEIVYNTVIKLQKQYLNLQPKQ